MIGVGAGVGDGVDGTGGNNSGAGVARFASAASSNGIGVTGTGNGTGAGVVGTGGNNGGTGAGVQGTGGSNGGPGVHGTSRAASAPGVLAENIASGPALQVSGPAAFSRSGALTVAAGKSSATQTGVALTSASLVLATLQQNLSGVYVRAAVPNTAGSSFTVYLSKAVTAATKVAWFIVN